MWLVCILVLVIVEVSEAFLCSSSAASISMSTGGLQMCAVRRLVPQDFSLCVKLLSPEVERSGAAIQLLGKVARNDGKILEEEDWFVLSAEWDRGSLPTLVAFQRTAIRVNCCVFARDASSASMLLNALHDKFPWHKKVMFPALQDDLLSSVLEIAAASGAQKVFEEPCYYYLLDRAVNEEGKDSKETRSLCAVDAGLVDATWKYRSLHLRTCDDACTQNCMCVSKRTRNMSPARAALNARRPPTFHARQITTRREKPTRGVGLNAQR